MRPFPAIDSSRLIDRLRFLAGIGRDPNGGISRLGFSQPDLRARHEVREMAVAGGLDTEVDAAGNLLVHYRAPHARRPPVVLGSHLDTVTSGGWLDGAYGVIAALEVLQVCAERRIPLEHDLIMVAFANEEGALFPIPFWGSMIFSGMLDHIPEEPSDTDGNLLRPVLAAAGGDLDRLDAAVWRPGSIAAYLELHVEQGPILETNGAQIGVVEAIVGRTLLQIDITGTAGHAGTSPMHGRKDALVIGAQLVTVVEDLSLRMGMCRVSTVGRVEVFPNSANTIPGKVRLTVDLRDSDGSRTAAAEAALRETLDAHARRHGVQIRCETLVRSKPVATDAGLRERIVAAAEAIEARHQALPSGAGHDAQMVAAIAPIGMIFVPSIGGRSHVPDEDTAEEDLVAGARVLLHTAWASKATNGRAAHPHDRP